MTKIDDAFLKMEEDEGNDTTRLWFYETVLSSELSILLAEEPEDDESIKPDLFPVDDQTFILAFDTEERLSNFTEKPVPFAALSGRTLIQLVQGKNLGIGLNLGDAPSAQLMGVDVINWMGQMLTDQEPDITSGKIKKVFQPRQLPPEIIPSLDRKLAAMEGMADLAYFCDVQFEDETIGSVLAFVNAPKEATNAIAMAVSEALVFSGIEAGNLDVLFLDDHDPICATLARVGLKFDLPKVNNFKPLAPGMDPLKPPRLQ